MIGQWALAFLTGYVDELQKGQVYVRRELHGVKFDVADPLTTMSPPSRTYSANTSQNHSQSLEYS
jgi:hypothetical protein